MKKVTIFLGALLLGISSFGQDIKVPAKYEFKTAQDYTLYKDSMVSVANWMIRTPLTTNHKMRESANKFILSWISGTPQSGVEINQNIANEVTKDKTNIYGTDILMNYAAGMILVKINNSKADELETQNSGIRAMLAGYESVVNFCTIKFLDSLQKQKDKGTLSDWIKANVIKS